ncbi:hypothetical protein HaLaN_28656 [Haematococcus lacustris]|uniref:Secreted protein n=1 Tax=Haematococcus lacustris TaxID=44745 RepID=A0A6A0AB48_HAELA|nr:hypothetical protein HaLaN_28656 [Haematococcus lacustris]
MKVCKVTSSGLLLAGCKFASAALQAMVTCARGRRVPRLCNSTHIPCLQYPGAGDCITQTRAYSHANIQHCTFRGNVAQHRPTDCSEHGKPKFLAKATARRNAHRVMAKKGSGKHKKDPGKKQKGACPQPTVSSVSYALCDNPSLLLVPSQRLVPFKASNDRSVEMAGPRADVRCRPRLLCPRTVIKVPEDAVLRGCKKTRRKGNNVGGRRLMCHVHWVYSTHCVTQPNNTI